MKSQAYDREVIMTVIERFEGDYAVIEIDGVMSEIKREQLPGNASEGDVIEDSGSGWRVNTEATKQRRAAVRRKLDRLIRKKND